MKVICSICKRIKELNEYDIKKLFNVITMSDQKVKADSYVRFLNIIEGNTCDNEKEHKFLFHDEFDGKINMMVEKRKLLHDNSVKLENEEKSLTFKKENLENELETVNTKLLNIPYEKEMLFSEINDLDVEFEKLTGTDDYTVFEM